MHIEYENDVEDMVAFNLHYQRETPAGRAMARRSALISSASVMVLFGIMALETREPKWLVAMVAGALLAIFYQARFRNWFTRLTVKRMYASGRNRSLIGLHRLSLEDQLQETSDGGATRTKYSSIERIHENEEYIFIYVSAVQAHVIPRRKVRAGNAKEFVDDLKIRLQSAV